MKSKLLLITIAFFLIFRVVQAQRVSVQKPFEKVIDTTIAYDWLKTDIMKIGLDDLTKTTEKLGFRFWCKN